MATATACLRSAPPPSAAGKATPRTHLSLPLPSAPISLRHLRPQRFPLTTSSPLRPNHKHLAPRQIPARALPKASPFLPFSLPPGPSLDLSGVTPLTVCKWTAVLAVAVAIAKKTTAVLLNPFFWTYFSFAWLFWPYGVAVVLALYGIYAYRRHSIGRATVVEQLAVVTAAVTWLTVVPPAHFNGFLEGWPVALFFVYHYFFFFESTVRRRLYGDLYPRQHDPKWDVGLPAPFRVGFAALVMVGHWLAAYEGPELHLISGGWANVATWALVALTLFMRYHSVLYLANYSEKVVVPTAVVQFGPYRWVRHPIYASTMLLFVLHCVTLRAPLSLLFLVAVGVVYYGRKADLEEELMLETFGERYKEYMNKVRYRLIPFVY